jgi:hypothetical protein
MSEAVSTTGILVKRRPLLPIATILTSSVAAASVITTSAAHGRVSGQEVTIAGHVGSTPSINGPHIITVLSPTTFSIPVNVTVAGTGGTATLTENPLNFTTLAEITSVTPPQFSRNKIETSTHNEGTESYILGILRQSDPAATINWVGGNATHETLLDDLLGNIKARWQFALPSGITLTGDARVQAFNPSEAPVDAAQQAEITWAWAGSVVIDTGA